MAKARTEPESVRQWRKLKGKEVKNIIIGIQPMVVEDVERIKLDKGNTMRNVRIRELFPDRYRVVLISKEEGREGERFYLNPGCINDYRCIEDN